MKFCRKPFNCAFYLLHDPQQSGKFPSYKEFVIVNFLSSFLSLNEKYENSFPFTAAPKWQPFIRTLSMEINQIPFSVTLWNKIANVSLSLDPLPLWVTMPTQTHNVAGSRESKLTGYICQVISLIIIFAFGLISINTQFNLS